MSVGGELETLVASAPELLARSFLSRSCLRPLLPSTPRCTSSAARASQADRPSAPSLSLHSSLCSPAVARRRSRQIATLALCDQSHRQRGSKYDIMHQCTSLYFQRCERCRTAVDRSAQPGNDNNPHRLYCSIVRSHEGSARPPEKSWQQADITLAGLDLGWRPCHDLVASLADLWEASRDQAGV